MNDIVSGVSRETILRLEHYAELIRKWNPRINLVSKSSLGELWSRHILDSLQAVLIPEATGHWVDLGSGGGFPGLVAAIVKAEHGSTFTLVESDQRKSAFLRTVIRELKLKAMVHTDRIENLEPLEADILSARALSDLDQLLAYSMRHLKEGGVAIFPKGESWQKEVMAARTSWSFDCTPIVSKTNPSAAILKIRDISRV